MVLCSFDMMSRRLYKTYVGLSNIVLRISAGTPESKEHAVLVNAHLDSTLPSPGAADDALPVGVMLECARVLVERWRLGEWNADHGVVFRKFQFSISLKIYEHDFCDQYSTMQKSLSRMGLSCTLLSIQQPRRESSQFSRLLFHSSSSVYGLS
jgi:Zn-dependent M28 family amino/carboxypeptidase